MALYGYARVSTDDQDLTIQREALKRAGCEVIREETKSGTTREGRRELELLMQFLRPGDTLVVTRIDRLARSMLDLQIIVHDLKQRGIALRATEQPIDSTTAAGKAFLDMLGVFAEFETNLRRERQAEGIAKAKQNGAYKGSKPKFDKARIHEMLASGQGPAAIASELGCSEMTVWRALKGDAPKANNDEPAAGWSQERGMTTETAA